MRIVLFPVLLLSLLTFVASQTNSGKKNELPVPEVSSKLPEIPKSVPKSRFKPIKETIEKRLEFHFYKYETKPSVIVNRIEDRETNIWLPNHQIKWAYSEWKGEKKETRITIDGDTFTLTGKLSINDPENYGRDRVDFSNQWENVKLYKLDDRELIAIQMNNDPCTGIGCSVSHTLVYDLKTKAKNFFGNFRTDNDVKLFHFCGDQLPQFVAKTYISETDGIAKEICWRYEIYSMDETGSFRLRKDENGNPYFLKRYFKVTDDWNNPEIERKFKQHWVETIK